MRAPDADHKDAKARPAVWAVLLLIASAAFFVASLLLLVVR